SFHGRLSGDGAQLDQGKPGQSAVVFGHGRARPGHQEKLFFHLCASAPQRWISTLSPRSYGWVVLGLDRIGGWVVRRIEQGGKESLHGSLGFAHRDTELSFELRGR